MCEREGGGGRRTQAREPLKCLCVAKTRNRKLPFISEMLLLNVFGKISVGSNVSFYFMKGLEVVSSVHCTWCGVFW